MIRSAMSLYILQIVYVSLHIVIVIFEHLLPFIYQNSGRPYCLQTYNTVSSQNGVSGCADSATTIKMVLTLHLLFKFQHDFCYSNVT